MTRPGGNGFATGEAPAVEPKVTWASVATFVGLYLATGLLELVRDQPVIVSPLPDWLEPIVVGLVPALLALIAGYSAPHAPRPDLPAFKR